MRTHFRRFGGFALVPALSILSSVLLLPTVTGAFGPDGLAAMTLGQSIGAFASVVIGLSWPVIGSHAIASTNDDADRGRIFVLSMASRGIVFVLLVPIAGVAAALLSPTYALESCLFAVGIAFNGFSAAYFYAGAGTPRPLVFNEGLTRFASYALALVGISVGLGLWWYALLMVVWGMASTLMNWGTITRWAARRNGLVPSARQALVSVREQTWGTTSRLAQSALSFGGASLFAGFRPGDLPQFSAVDQLQKSFVNAAMPVTISMLHWVGVPQVTRSLRCRSLVAFGISAAGSLMFLCLWLAFGPWLIDVLFAGEIFVGYGTVVMLGVSVVAVYVTRSFELVVMVPRGYSRSVFTATAYSALVGTLGVALSALTIGINGALVSVLGASLICLLHYAIVLMAQRRLL